MRLRKSVGISSKELNDLEFLKTPASPEALEALYRHLAAASDELDELCALAIIKFLEHLKEPFDDW